MVPLYPSSTLSTIGWAVAAYTCPALSALAAHAAARQEEAGCRLVAYQLALRVQAAAGMQGCFMTF